MSSHFILKTEVCITAGHSLSAYFKNLKNLNKFIKGNVMGMNLLGGSLCTNATLFVIAGVRLL